MTTNNNADDNSSSSEMDPYHIEGLHGTLAPVSCQEHYDTRSDADLVFDDSLVGRSAELEMLQSVYYGEHGKADADSTGGSSSKVVFIGGYSGVGKSSLVRHFVREIQQRSDAGPILYGEGKFQSNHSVPFSAFHDMIARLVSELESAGLTKEVRAAIKSSEDFGGSEGGRVLLKTWPGLAGLLDADDKHRNTVKSRTDDEGRLSSDVGLAITMNAIKEYTLSFLTLICDNIDTVNQINGDSDNAETMSAPKQRTYPLMILFLDDLQWADSPSLELLQHLLSEKSPLMNKLMFLCAYRSNEVDEHHSLMRVIREVTMLKIGVENHHNSAAGKLINDANYDSNNDHRDTDNNPYKMELYPLSPATIQQFLAQTLSKDPSDVTNLSQVIYKKTMGNIFYVRQAVEELVRKNALYYDNICFEWMFADSSSDLLEEYISDDVVDSVIGKIAILDEMLRQILIVMGYIPNTLEIRVLRQLLQSTGREVTDDELIRLLNLGVDEGMLLLSSESGLYIFAHDKIRQASTESIGDEERDEMLLQLADVLLDMYEDAETATEWCIFLAVNYLNSFEPGSKTDALELARLNLKVAACARKRGDMEKEYWLLGHSLKCLHSANKVWNEYELTLDIYNRLINAAEVLGKFDESRFNVKEVLNHAKNLDDKLVAHRYKIALTYAETRDYNESLKEGICILKMYGFDFPQNPSAAECFKEEMKVKVALRNRPYSCMLEQPLVKNPLMEIFKVVTAQALLTGKVKLLKLIAWKAVQLGLDKGIDNNFHGVLVCLGHTLAREKEIKTAFEVANTAVLMAEKFREDRGNSAYTQLVAFQGVLLQLQSFRSGVDVLLQCYRDLKLDGQNDPALGSAMCHILAIFASGLTIGPLIEAKLLLIEDFARKAGLASFCSVFQMQRQFLLNLWKTSRNPTELKGLAFDEDRFLGSLEVTSNVYATTRRDTSTYRIILAFVFCDHDCMARMLDVLHPYPTTEPAVPRLHLRLAFMGLSALLILQQKKNKNFQEIARTCLAHFRDLTKLGSVNAKPVYLFMLALKSPSIQSFERAINSCEEAQCHHLVAMSKEHYGLYLCEGRNIVVGQDYLVSAYWSYCEWGAHAKSHALQVQHPCIKTASKEAVNSRVKQALSIASGGSSQKDREFRFGPMKKGFSVRLLGNKPSMKKFKSKSSKDILANR